MISHLLVLKVLRSSKLVKTNLCQIITTSNIFRESYFPLSTSEIGTRTLVLKDAVWIFFCYYFFFFGLHFHHVFKIYSSFNSIFSFETKSAQNIYIIIFTSMVTRDMRFFATLLSCNCIIRFFETYTTYVRNRNLFGKYSFIMLVYPLSTIILSIFYWAPFVQILINFAFFFIVRTLSITFFSCISVFMSLKKSSGWKDVVNPF